MKDISAVSKRNNKEIPDIVIGRLPVYLRTLRLLADEGRDVTSSQELGGHLGISSAQIRKDLSHFGEFGKQGTGYNITFLCNQLQKILNVDRVWPIVLVGAGSLGNAIANYAGFESRGFRIVAIFDEDKKKIGLEMGPVFVDDFANLKQRVEETSAQISVIAVPTHAAQRVADQLIEAGLTSILCYAPITLTAPPHVRVEYIDPVVHFQHMTYYLG
jgi:redox-sensing transcriptional repressor